jgi:hypothetical protein
MRALPVLFTGLIAASVFTAACGSVDTPSGTSQGTTTTTTSGVGGAGGSGAATSSTDAATTSTDASSSASSGSTGGGGPDIGQPSDVYPAKHAAAPKVVTAGGPVLAAPKVWPIFFQGDKPTIVNATTDFFAKIGPSDYWTAAVTEYGVGALSSGPAQTLGETAPLTTTDDEIQAWLAQKLNNGDLAFPVPDSNTIIALTYPVGTSIDLQGSKSCQAFLGYHSNLTLDAAHGNKDVAYIVIPRCSMQSTGMNELDSITDTGSHELAEAATDPYPQTNPAYAQVDNNHIYWLFALGGGENGDMCAQSAGASYKDPQIGYVVQRPWSNKAAAASHDPCVPAPAGQVYFNSAPLLNDTITLGGGGQSLKVKGVQIPIGSTKTIEIDLFSDAPTNGPWQVEAHDLNEFMGGQPTLQFAFDAPGGQNGQKLHLSITPTKANQYKSEEFFIISTLGNQQNAWIGIVGN